MSAPQGMLEGDKFSLEQWASAIKQKPTQGPTLPDAVEAALQQLLDVCEEHGTPVLTVVSAGRQTQFHSRFGDKPENVSGELMMARSTVCTDPVHAMGVAASVMRASGMKF